MTGEEAVARSKAEFDEAFASVTKGMPQYRRKYFERHVLLELHAQYSVYRQQSRIPLRPFIEAEYAAFQKATRRPGRALWRRP